MFSGVWIQIPNNRIQIRLSNDQIEARQVKMQKWIRIPQRKNRFQNVQTEKLEEKDLNPYGVDSNPNSNKSA